MEEFILTIDRGQTSIKAALCDSNANVIAVVSENCQAIQTPYPKWAEQDMDLIWEQATKAIRVLLQDTSVCPEQIAAISFSGQGGGNFLVDVEGNPVRAGVLSMDARHEEIRHLLNDEKANTIPKTILFMRWLKENEPSAYEKTRWILGSKDWIRFKMTGNVNADMSDTAAPIDFETGEYILDGCMDADVEDCMNRFPPLMYGNRVCGEVTEEAALLCGLNPGTPVVVGLHDMIACSIGAGGQKQGHLTIIIGTMGINIAVVDEETQVPPSERMGEWFVFAGVQPKSRMSTTSIGSGGQTMEWALDTFFSGIRKEAKEQGLSAFRYVEKLLQDKPYSDVIFFPYIHGTFYNHTAKAGFFRITSKTKREDLLMGVYQGICFAMCLEIKKLQSFLGVLDDIWIVGGGSKSNIWGQMFADVLQTQVHISETSEVASRGAAICALDALEMLENVADIHPKIKKTYIPNQADKEKVEELYETYRTTKTICEPSWI